jgi:uncharacterized tellurite resistance protein B-like protein
MLLSLLSTLHDWIFGPGDLAPSLLLDRYGNLVNKELSVALSTLLIAMSLTDEMLHTSEVAEIIRILREQLALSQKAAEEALHTALEARKAPDDVFPKLRALTSGMCDDQKEHLVSLALRVAAADEIISRAEAHIVSRLAELLRLTPEQIERARKSA